MGSIPATVAPTFRSNFTRPSASSRRMASRTGTTLTPRSSAILAEHQPVAGGVGAVHDPGLDGRVGLLGLAAGGRGSCLRRWLSQSLALPASHSWYRARHCGVHRVEAVHAVALLHHLGDEGFLAFLRDGVVRELLGEGRRDHQDAVGVGRR